MTAENWGGKGGYQGDRGIFFSVTVHHNTNGQFEWVTYAEVGQRVQTMGACDSRHFMIINWIYVIVIANIVIFIFNQKKCVLGLREACGSSHVTMLLFLLQTRLIGFSIVLIDLQFDFFAVIFYTIEFFLLIWYSLLLFFHCLCSLWYVWQETV